MLRDLRVLRGYASASSATAIRANSWTSFVQIRGTIRVHSWLKSVAKNILAILFIIILTGCSTVAPPTQIAQPIPSVIIPTPTLVSIPTASVVPTPTPQPIVELTAVLTDFLGLRAPTLAWSIDNQTLAFAGRQRSVKLWSRADQRMAEAKIYTYVSALNWSDDGLLNVAGYDSTAWRINQNGTINLSYTNHANAVFAVAPNPRQDLIVSASSDKRLRWWDTAGNEINVINNESSVWNAVWNPDGTLLATSDGDYAVKLWSNSGTLQATLKGHTDDPLLLAWNGDGSMLASADIKGHVFVWSRTGKMLQTWQDSSPIQGLVWHPSNRWLTWLTADGTIKQEAIEANVSQIPQPAFTQPIAWNPSGTMLAIAHDLPIVELRDQQGNAVQYLEGHTAAIVGVTWSNDGHWLATASADGTVRVWEIVR